MSNLETDIKIMIIEELELEDITVEDIDSEAALFGEGLELDSIDALELGLAINKRFGVKFEANAEQNQVHFSSVSALAKFISANQKKG